jgi:hypothetical protein
LKTGLRPARRLPALSLTQSLRAVPHLPAKMHHLAVVLTAAVVGLARGSLATCHGVFCTVEIPPNCKAPAVCGTLYFYNEAGENITKLQGSGDYKSKDGLDKKAIKGVVSVQQVGTGCYRIYKGKKYDGELHTLVGNNKINLREQGFEATTIK